MIEDKKGENIVLLDVRRLSEVTDYYLLVSGTSGPHLRAIFSEIQHVLKGAGVHCYRRAGSPESGWLVLDYIDVIIHIFLPELRQYYAIEELWGKKRPVRHPAQEKRRSDSRRQTPPRQDLP